MAEANHTRKAVEEVYRLAEERISSNEAYLTEKNTEYSVYCKDGDITKAEINEYFQSLWKQLERWKQYFLQTVDEQFTKQDKQFLHLRDELADLSANLSTSIKQNERNPNSIIFGIHEKLAKVEETKSTFDEFMSQCRISLKFVGKLNLEDLHRESIGTVEFLGDTSSAEILPTNVPRVKLGQLFQVNFRLTRSYCPASKKYVTHKVTRVSAGERLKIQSYLFDQKDGKFSLGFPIATIEPHTVSIEYMGKPIKNSPYTIYFKAGASSTSGNALGDTNNNNSSILDERSGRTTPATVKEELNQHVAYNHTNSLLWQKSRDKDQTMTHSQEHATVPETRTEALLDSLVPRESKYQSMAQVQRTSVESINPPITQIKRSPTVESRLLDSPVEMQTKTQIEKSPEMKNHIDSQSGDIMRTRNTRSFKEKNISNNHRNIIVSDEEIKRPLMQRFSNMASKFLLDENKENQIDKDTAYDDQICSPPSNRASVTNDERKKSLKLLNGSLKAKQVHEIKSGFHFPIGCGNGPDNQVFICDTGHGVVRHYDGEYKLIDSIGRELNMHRPSKVCYSDQDRTLFMKDDREIYSFDIRSNRLIRRYEVRPKSNLYGLLLSESTNEIVTLEASRGHLHFLSTRDSKLRRTESFAPLLELSGNARRQTKCRFLDFNGNGDLICSDLGLSLIYLTTLNGSKLNTFGGFGPDAGLFCEPSGVTSDYSGHVLIADSKHDRIQVFDDLGNYICPVETNQRSRRPSDILLTKSCRHLLVMNYLDHLVKVYELSGNI